MFGHDERKPECPGERTLMPGKRRAECSAWALCALFPELRAGFFSRLASSPPVFSRTAEPRLWLHAATRREARLARLLADELKAQAPGLELLFTSLTQDAQSEFAGCEFARCRLLPFESPALLRRLWEAARPQGLVLIENELWPGLLALAREHEIPAFVANARFAEDSPWALAPQAIPPASLFLMPTYLARHDTDWKALREAGVSPEKLLVCGELRIDAALREAGARVVGEVPCVVGVGTQLADERLLFAAYRRLLGDYPRLRLVLVPRAPKRARALWSLARAQGFTAETNVATLSAQSPEVIVLPDSKRLAAYYAQAQAAYVGGGLEKGQGLLDLCEPVLHGVPVLCGPQLGDWRPFAQLLDEAGALSFVQDAQDVARVAAICISQAAELSQALRLGRARLCQHRGAAQRQAALILHGLPRNSQA